MNAARVGLILAGLLLAGCDHRENAGSGAPAATDSAYTGLPASYPRATPANIAQTTSQPAPQASATSPVAENPTPAAVPPPPVKFATPAPVVQEPPPSVTTGLPVPAAAEPPETTPPTTPVLTVPPRPMDEHEAKEQVVVLQTSLGNIVIELNDLAAPRTCGNFRKLVANGFYNHTVFHRVIPNFMIQGGDPNSKSDDRRTYGLGDPGYTLPPEISLKHTLGAVAMARQPDSSNPQRESNGSQFYICVAACPSLDGQYTVFGHVIRGMDTATKIANQPRDKNDDPVDRVEVQVSLETKQQALDENPR